MFAGLGEGAEFFDLLMGHGSVGHDPSVAETIRLGRPTIATLNDEHTPAAKTDRQPGVRSGFVNPFCIIAGDAEVADGGVAVTVRRIPGTAIHSAQAKASDASLIEKFEVIADAAGAAFGEDKVLLGGIEIGEDRNFNTYDGSGMMTLAVAGAELEAVEQWARSVDVGGIDFAVASCFTASGSIFGFFFASERILFRESLD